MFPSVNNYVLFLTNTRYIVSVFYSSSVLFIQWDSWFQERIIFTINLIVSTFCLFFDSLVIRWNNMKIILSRLFLVCSLFCFLLLYVISCLLLFCYFMILSRLTHTLTHTTWLIISGGERNVVENIGYLAMSLTHN